MRPSDIARQIRYDACTLQHHAYVLGDNIDKDMLRSGNIAKMRDYMQRLDTLLAEAEKLPMKDKE